MSGADRRPSDVRRLPPRQPDVMKGSAFAPVVVLVWIVLGALAVPWLVPFVGAVSDAYERYARWACGC